MSSKLRSLMIQLRDDQIAVLDQQAGALGASRSKVIRDALDAVLHPGADLTVEARYAAAYPQVAGTSSGPSWAEMWWCDAPGGSSGSRPGAVLILSRAEAARHLPRLLVARTSAVVRGLPSEVTLDRGDGVEPCVVDLDLPETVDRATLTRRLGVLSAHRWQQVADALRASVNV